MRFILVMAALCLNFCYGQQKQKQLSPIELKGCQYGITGFKSGFKAGYVVSKNSFLKSKAIIVRNYSLSQLFALAMGAGEVIKPENIIVDVREPKKLQQLYCYKLIVPPAQVDNFYVLMMQNLIQEFSVYEVKIECRDNKDMMLIKDRDDEL
ncbi:MAG TPA: hypothetical protein VKB19_01255 [Pedobacter sp.]|nr:hypothetical protein [Pedobacter sp.]